MPLLSHALLVVILHLRVASAGQNCTKEQYAAKFGAQPLYELHALGAGVKTPTIEGKFVVLDVSYESFCEGGGSEFTATLHNKFGTNVVFVSRNEPECDNQLLVPAVFRGIVYAELPDGALPTLTISSTNSGTLFEPPDEWNEEEDGVWEPPKSMKKTRTSPSLFIAFPPDGDYELYALSNTTDSSLKKPIDDLSDEGFDPYFVVHKRNSVPGEMRSNDSRYSGEARGQTNSEVSAMTADGNTFSSRNNAPRRSLLRRIIDLVNHAS